MEFSPGVLVIIAFTGLLSSFVSGIFGMAGGQIFLAVLLLYMPVASALVVFAVVQVASGAWRGWLWRRYVHWGITWRYITGSVVTYLLMRYVSFVPGKPMVYLGIGLMPFAAFALPKKFAPDITRRGAAFVCGSFVMLLQLVVGQAGNVLDVFFQASPLDRKTVVATKALTQLVSQILRILYFGAFAGDVVEAIPYWAWACFLATAIGGTSLAPIVLHRMTDAGFRKWTKVIIACFSALYVARGLWLLATGER
jgi:uncharacterized membrane protein YfcA